MSRDRLPAGRPGAPAPDARLNIWSPRVRDFQSRPIYNVGERSGIKIRAATAAFVALLTILGSRFALFAMWFDMESNKDLR
jgi:hypothetical protein